MCAAGGASGHRTLLRRTWRPLVDAGAFRTKISPGLACLQAYSTSSAYIMALEMPMALMGYTALPVDRQMAFLTPCRTAAVSTLSVPIIVDRTASMGKNPQEGCAELTQVYE